MVDLNSLIKKAFGEKMKVARSAAGYSRAKLAVELGVSAKTIQSWEVGRTFPENMSLIPVIENKLNFFVPDILGKTVREEIAKLKKKTTIEETEETSPKIVRKAATTEEEEVKSES